MSAFNSDDTYNVIAEHVIEALQADAKFGSGGALAIKKWEQELRESAGDYNENELPAVAVTVDLSTQDEIRQDQDRTVYMALVMLYAAGGRLLTVQKNVKYYAARIERVMQQQYYTAKQLASVTADLADAVSGSVVVEKVTTEIGAGAFGESQTPRGVAALGFAISIDFTITED